MAIVSFLVTLDASQAVTLKIIPPDPFFLESANQTCTFEVIIRNFDQRMLLLLIEERVRYAKPMMNLEWTKVKKEGELEGEGERVLKTCLPDSRWNFTIITDNNEKKHILIRITNVTFDDAGMYVLSALQSQRDEDIKAVTIEIRGISIDLSNLAIELNDNLSGIF